MLFSRMRWGASFLFLGMSAAMANAQPPSGPATSPPPSGESPAAAYSQSELEHLFDENGNYLDELDLGPRFRFQADWVSYTRQNNSRSLPIVTGEEPFSLGGATFDRTSGYRLSLSYLNDDYELEGSFFELDGLNGTQSGTLTNAVIFDGSAAFTTAIGLQPGLAATTGATPNFLESTSLFSPINAAANHFSADPLIDETNELEFFDPGARYALQYTSSLQDFDINLKGRRQSGRLLRFGFGYRNIQFNENGLAALRGTFNTLDNDNDETPVGDNDPNNGIGSPALTGAGLAATAAGDFTENDPRTELLFRSSQRATNQLNGVQATLDGTLLESEYFSIGGYAKAGLFHNAARGSITETYQDLETGGATYTRSFSDSNDRVAFAGNLGVTGTVFFSENVRLFGGYELMYLSGVALAPEQTRGITTDIADVTSLNLRSDSDVLFHGARLGLEFLFP